MINQRFLFVITCLLSILLSSCDAIAGIFKAGMVWGIFLVFLVIAVVIYLISRGGKK